MKNISRTHSIFFGIFTKKLNAQGIQTARTGVHTAGNQETEKKSRKPWVPNRILIKRLAARGAGLGQNPPGPAPYIKGSNPVSFIFFPLSLSSSLLRRWFSETLTLTLLKLTQNLTKHGSIASFHCSNHESGIEIHMH